jgi:amino acid adenylation domain-containing protein
MMETNQIRPFGSRTRNSDPSDHFDKRGLDFWMGYLAAAPALLELPTDRPRPAVPGFAGSVAVALTAELTAGLRELSQRQGVTLFMTLLAGWSALLGRLSGQSDVVIGAPVQNRRRGELDMLALRVRLEGDPTVGELLARIKASTVEAYAHQDILFGQVVEALQVPRDLNHHPIFQVMLALDKGPGDRAPRVVGRMVSDAEAPQSTLLFDLTLSLIDAGERIEGALEYASDLFDRSSIERMTGHLRIVLESMVADDQQRISELNLLSLAERQQLLAGWNATPAEFPTGTLPVMLAAQVRRTPLAEAVVDGTRVLNYAELDRAADSLAAALQQLGVGAETVVGVARYRSLETVVAAWAILKAGGVYLPLDPAFPAHRLAYMLRDAGARLVITDQSLASRLPNEIPQWRLEQTPPSGTPVATHLTPEHLAYIVYTSGSTGEPKGVAVSHGSAVNLAFARTQGHDPIGPGDRVLAAISVGFDVSIGQLLLPLLSGACVVIAPELRTLSPEAFWDLLVNHRVSHVNSVPSFFDSVLDAAAQRPGLRLKRLMLGGEALSGALCRRLRVALPDTELVNMYGPTEACIDATAYPVPDPIDESLAVMPIGRPLANYRAYVLNPRLRPQPVGVVGELFLGGAGLARGYVGRPELTAERFVADPFGPPGERLYRTGDRALWRSDGILLFLGRGDEQLKIRGFRVEPGEIEAALRTHPQIAQAAVVLRNNPPSPAMLVAYVVHRGSRLAISQLREHLAERLPEHMIPTAIVSLDALPLNSNGKLDRKALPALDQSSLAMQHYEAPVGELEGAIASIWQGLLGLPRVGRHDNFFDLGGDSQLVLRFLATLKAQIDRPIAVAWVFQAPTPAQLATLMSQRRTEHAWKHLVALNDGGNRRPLFCLNGFDGDAHDYLNIARYLDPSVPLYGLEVSSEAVDENFHEALDTRMNSYLREIRGVQPSGPYRLCGFSFGGSEAFDLARRLEDEGEEVLLLLLDAYRPSNTLIMMSWLPRIVGMVRSHQVFVIAMRKIKNLFTFQMHHWVTGKDKDLRHALHRRAIKRKYEPFSGRVILFKSTGLEEWPFQLKLDGWNGWRKSVKGPFELIQLDVGHAAMMREPTVMAVVSHLNAILCD